MDFIIIQIGLDLVIDCLACSVTYDIPSFKMIFSVHMRKPN